jgi:hypothetical protein
MGMVSGIPEIFNNLKTEMTFLRQISTSASVVTDVEEQMLQSVAPSPIDFAPEEIIRPQV